MIILRWRTFSKWIRHWAEWMLEWVYVGTWTWPVIIIPAKTFTRLVGFTIQQPCWRAGRWRSLT